MGALEINPKKRDFNYKLDTSLFSETHVVKKPRFEPNTPELYQDRPFVLRSTVSRVLEYPEKLTRFKRPVHAPCRGKKVKFLKGNISRFYLNYMNAKKEALSTFRFCGGGKEFVDDVEVIDTDDCKYGGLKGTGVIDVDDVEVIDTDDCKYGCLKGNGVIDVDDVEVIDTDDCKNGGLEGKEVIDVDDVEVIDTDDCKYGCLKGNGVIDVDDVEVIDTDDCKNGGLEGKEVIDVEKGKGKGKLRGMDRGVEEVNCQPSCSSVVSEDLVGGNWREESGEKGLEIVERREKVDGFDEPLHEKLKKSVEKSNEKLGFLGSMIEFFNKKLSGLQLFQRGKKPDKDVDRMLFVPLTDDEENEVTVSFSNAKRRKVLVTHQESNIEITGELLQCLRPGAWLNDEVINLYLVLLKEREQRDPQKYLKCHFFNTFFYKKLIGGRGGYDYKSVRRWTTQRKLGYCLFECDKIFIPIHKEIHWCLAIINKKDEKFQYLDSLRGRDKKVMTVLARYFVDEVKDKSGKDIDVSSWKQEFVDDLPEQQNGYDCGVFMIKYSDFYSKDVGLCFNQEHMPYFRRRTAKEILRLKAD